MNARVATAIVALIALFFPITAAAQFNVGQGGTGLNAVPTGAYLVGNNGIRLTSTTSPTVGYITATSGTSTLPKIIVSSAINFLGDYITNVATWFASRADTWLATKSTSNLTEGSNLYYTDVRVLAYVTSLSKGFFFSTTSTSFFASLGLAHSTTSTAYQISTIDKGYFFSTTSDSNFAANGLAFSTTSDAYFASTGRAFSTTSAAYFLTQNQGAAFSSTSAAYYLTVFPPASFSTTSATYFTSLGLAFSTTSADAWFATKSISGFSTTSADFWKTQRDVFSTTSASYFLSQNTGQAFSTTSANAWKALNNFFSTTSASAFSAIGLAHSTTSVDYQLSTKGYLTGNQTVTLSGDVTGSGATAITTSLAHTVAHFWSALQNFTNASTSQLTATSSVWLTSLATPAGTILAVDPTGKVISTSTSAGGVTNVTASAPIFTTGGATPNLSWAGLATTSQPASSNLLTSNGANGVYGTATSTLTPSSPLTGSFVQIGAGGSLGIQQGTAGQNGYLASGDWTSFNSRLSTSTLGLFDKGYFFSTTSASVFSANGLSFSTTSTDYWQSQRNFFSTTSASNFTSVGLAHSTTSSAYFLSQNQGAAFSTTSANFFASVGLGHSTTSVAYQLTQPVILGNATSTSFFTTTSSSTNLFASSGKFGSSTIGVLTTIGTTTGANGFNISAGCFAINGVCLTSSAGSSASTTLLADFNTFTGGNVFGNATTTNLGITGIASTSNLTVSSIRSALLLTGATGIASGYAGTSCTNQAFISLSATGGAGCGTFLQSIGNFSTTTGANLSFSTTTTGFNGLTLGQTIGASANGLLFTPTITGTLNNAGLTNSSITITAGTGLAGGGTVALGGTVTVYDTSSISTSSADVRGQLAAWGSTNGTPASLFSVATTTGGCSGTVSCPTFTILGSSPVTITGAAGSAASSTLLADINTWTGTNAFGKITATEATSTVIASTFASTTNLRVSSAQNVLLGTDSKGLVSGASLSGPISFNAGTLTLTQANGAGTNGYLSSADWGSFNSRLSTSTLGLIDKGFFFSTTSASVFSANGLAFSTTSDAYFASVGLAFSTTSALAHLTSIDKGFFFSTTSTDAWLATKSIGGFSTTSALFFSSVGLAHSTTSVAYQLTQPVILGNATSTNFSTTNASTTNLWISAIRNGLVATNGIGGVVATTSPTALSFTSTGNTASIFPYASTTALTVSSAFFGAGLTNCNSGNVLTWSSATGQFGCAADATGAGGGAWPFTVGTTNFNVAVQSTSTPEQFLAGVFASSTSQFVNAIFSGVVGQGTSTPWGALSVSSSTAYKSGLPVFSISTSSEQAGQLFNVFSTSTGLVTTFRDFANGIFDSGVRIIIGAVDQFGYKGGLDQIFVNGRINTGDWHTWECMGGVHGMTSSSLLNSDSAVVCPFMQFQIDTGGQISFNPNGAGAGADAVPVSGILNDRLENITVGGSFSTTAVRPGANGVGLFVNNGGAGTWIPATSTPIMETVVRIDQPQNATSTKFFFGFSNLTPSGTTFETDPTLGCWFSASSSKANWQAECRTSMAANTTVDTGIASSTSITSTGNFMRLRLEMDANAATFYIQKNGTPMQKVAVISTNYPANSQGVSTGFSGVGMWIGSISAGLANGLDMNYIRMWYYQPVLVF